MSWLRRATAYPSGIAAGGGDTGWDRHPQPVLLTKQISSAYAEGVLPKGTLLLGYAVIPNEAAAPSAGTVAIVNQTSGASYASGVDATIPSWVMFPSVEALPEETRFRFTPTSITADKGSFVGLYVILPPARP